METEIREALRDIRSIDPSLPRLELYQVRKKVMCPKYNQKSISHLVTVKPQGFK